MFYQCISKKVYIAIYPLPLVYDLYACENIDNCERPLLRLSL